MVLCRMSIWLLLRVGLVLLVLMMCRFVWFVSLCCSGCLNVVCVWVVLWCSLCVIMWDGLWMKVVWMIVCWGVGVFELCVIVVVWIGCGM